MDNKQINGMLDVSDLDGLRKDLINRIKSELARTDITCAEIVALTEAYKKLGHDTILALSSMMLNNCSRGFGGPTEGEK